MFQQRTTNSMKPGFQECSELKDAGWINPALRGSIRPGFQDPPTGGELKVAGRFSETQVSEDAVALKSLSW